MKPLIIPGVQVEVVKEVVTAQLSPSGVVGLVGLVGGSPAGHTVRVQSWSRFIELFGAASAYSVPEAQAILANGAAELVVAPVSDDPAACPAAANVKNAENEAAFTLTAKARGSWANGLTVMVAQRKTLGAETPDVFDMTILSGATPVELLRGLRPADAVDTINTGSQLVVATLGRGGMPSAASSALSGGKDAQPGSIRASLALLENEPDVDLVLVSLQDFGSSARVAEIYGDIISHCQRMSARSCGRIGVAHVPPLSDPSGTDLSAWTELADNLKSDRFVLLAPTGVAGAVAGMIGSLDYFQSPTFKLVGGLASTPAPLGVEAQETLLKSGIVPVAFQRGRGTVVLRGLTTDGDQISVRRVADRAVRGVKLIGELFIGRLNNESGRGALKQKLIEFFVQMERDGAIVPSTDGKLPAYTVEVYSSQSDFSQGIVRVNLAVRPVRAIDYIYATVLVQA